jgi:DNA invertase Pin-like site-specific DNA recombinase
MGDTVVVTKLDRFARSTQDALNYTASFPAIVELSNDGVGKLGLE